MLCCPAASIHQALRCSCFPVLRPATSVHRHILFIMPAYPSGCIMNTTGVVPPIGRGEVGGNKTWIRADGWTRLDVSDSRRRAGPAWLRQTAALPHTHFSMTTLLPMSMSWPRR